MVAAGQLDAYYEDGVHVWDWAAGALIAAEAGAAMRSAATSTVDGSDLIVAAAPGIADARSAGGAGAGEDGAGERSDDGAGRLGVQQAPAWTLDSRERSAGWVASGRRLASTASVSSLWLRSPKSVPIARSTVSSGRWSWIQLGAWRDQPECGGGGPTCRAEPDLALALQAGVLVDRVVRGSRRRVAEVAKGTGDLGGLAALPAGVEHADLGVGELGGGHLCHRRGHDLISERGLGGVRRGRWRVAGGDLVHVGGPIEGGHPYHQGDDGEHGHDDQTGHVVPPTERTAVFVERRP